MCNIALIVLVIEVKAQIGAVIMAAMCMDLHCMYSSKFYHRMNMRNPKGRFKVILIR